MNSAFHSLEEHLKELKGVYFRKIIPFALILCLSLFFSTIFTMGTIGEIADGDCVDMTKTAFTSKAEMAENARREEYYYIKELTVYSDFSPYMAMAGQFMVEQKNAEYLVSFVDGEGNTVYTTLIFSYKNEINMISEIEKHLKSDSEYLLNLDGVFSVSRYMSGSQFFDEAYSVVSKSNPGKEWNVSLSYECETPSDLRFGPLKSNVWFSIPFYTGTTITLFNIIPLIKKYRNTKKRLIELNENGSLAFDPKYNFSRVLQKLLDKDRLVRLGLIGSLIVIVGMILTLGSIHRYLYYLAIPLLTIWINVLVIYFVFLYPTKKFYDKEYPKFGDSLISEINTEFPSFKGQKAYCGENAMLICTAFKMTMIRYDEVSMVCHAIPIDRHNTNTYTHLEMKDKTSIIICSTDTEERWLIKEKILPKIPDKLILGPTKKV